MDLWKRSMTRPAMNMGIELCCSRCSSISSSSSSENSDSSIWRSPCQVENELQAKKVVHPDPETVDRPPGSGSINTESAPDPYYWKNLKKKFKIFSF